jgi:opacity protein-like surface antigen
MPRLTVSLVLVLLAPASALAMNMGTDPNLHVDPSVEDCSVRFAPNLTQDAFRRFAREFGSVSAFKQASAPGTLGAGHFALALGQTYFSVEEHSAAWNDTFVHPSHDHPLGAHKEFPLLRLRAGVTDDLDLGAYYTVNPEANYGWLGLEGKYALLRERQDQPFTVAVRAAYTKTLYVADMNMHAVTAEVSAGHTFWKVLTPYLGVGADGVFVKETSAAVDLHNENLLVPHVLAGVEARWWHLSAGAEVQVGAIPSVQVQLAALF